MEDDTYEDLISSVTSRESADGVTTYQNTVSIACPACGEPFDDLVVCEHEFSTLELSLVLDLCVTTHDDSVLLFTHKR